MALSKPCKTVSRGGGAASTIYLNLVLASLLCVPLAGCQALAEMQEQQRAQQQAVEDNLRARIAELTPEQRDAAQKCSSIAEGRINALRNARQGAGTYNMNDYTVVDACLNNPYYYETIPAPAVVINVPPQQQQMPQSFNCTTTSITPGVANTNCN